MALGAGVAEGDFWRRAGRFVESGPAQWFITALIVVNATILRY